MPDKILIVDDEPDTLDLAKTILEGEGYQAIVAHEGEECLQKAEAESPDLILLDMVMPGKSGLEICKTLKTQSKTKFTPVVMFTALGREVDRKLGGEAGADGYFVKPFTPESIIAEVKNNLEKVRPEKFSRALDMDHTKLTDRKILLEFDPTSSYERLVRDFVLEGRAHGEKAVIITPKSSIIYKSLQEERKWLILSLGTDGIDGPTDAAGAWITPSILKIIQELSLDPIEYLDNNDSYNFFKKADRLILTGPTHTNVMDLRLFLIE